MPKRIKAVSLIEVLIAIFIFAVGILAVLQMIIKTLTTVDKISLQTQATILASQGVEIVRTIRNTNIMKGVERDCAESSPVQGGVLQGDCLTPFYTAGNVLSVAMEHGAISDANPYVSIQSDSEDGSFAERFERFQIYAHTGTLPGSNTQFTWFDHNQSNGFATNFARLIRIVPSPIKGADEEAQEDFIRGLESVVLIQKGSYTGTIIMESLLGKIYE